jgi:3-oxoacyl-[acyl-carrier protein] reductase
MPERKTALVTGGTRGIGLGICQHLAEAGFDLAVTGLRDRQSIEEVLDRLKETGRRVDYFQSDLGDVSRHASLVQRVVNEFGGITCLVNNAGIASLERGEFLQLKQSNLQKILDTNLLGTVFLTQAVVSAMLASSSPHSARTIVNITSVSATMTSPERLDYCMTKAALSAFTSGLAVRLAGEGISVFEVRPGIIRTDMTSKVASKYDERIASGLVPMNRWGEAEDIGSAVAVLASGSMAFATGSVIAADGGLSIARL